MKKLKLSALALAALVGFSACSKPADKKKEDKNASKAGPEKVVDNFVVENEGNPVGDATLKIAYVSDSAFKGTFHQAFAQENPDMEPMTFAMNGSFQSDEDMKLTKGGPCEAEFNADAKKVTVTINDKYTWNDGVPVTSKDFLEYYKIIAHKDYDGVRFDDDMKTVVGIMDYHNGKSKEISGFKILSDKKFEVTFSKFGPGNLWGGGIPFEPVPAHVYSKIPVKEQAGHDATRKHPLSPGPYYFKEIVPGQQIVMEANPHFWKGAPKVKRVIWKIVPSSQIIAALQSGEYDMTISLNSDLYKKAKELKNSKLIIKDELSYSYVGFNLGKWEKGKGAVPNPNAKMADKNLRKAMAYAVDNDAVGEKFYHGTRRNATQLIVPAFKNFYDKDLKGFTYDVEKAKKLLDDAGYKDTNGDGLREDKNGKPLKIKFASMAGGETAEPIAQYYMQQWKKIGLDVELSTGRLIEFKLFYEKVQANDPEIDVYMAAWGTGSNPDPTGLYGRGAQFNMTRFATKELDAILEKIGSKEALQKEFREKVYKEFSNYMFEEAPVFPTLFRKKIQVINNRVKKYDDTYGTTFRPEDIELTAKDPVK